MAEVVSYPPVYAMTCTSSNPINALLGGTCWVWQVRRAAATLGYADTIEAAIPADVNNAVHILWEVGGRTQPNDLLYQAVSGAIGASAAAQVYANAPSVTTTS